MVALKPRRPLLVAFWTLPLEDSTTSLNISTTTDYPNTGTHGGNFTPEPDWKMGHHEELGSPFHNKNFCNSGDSVVNGVSLS